MNLGLVFGVMAALSSPIPALAQSLNAPPTEAPDAASGAESFLAAVSGSRESRLLWVRENISPAGLRNHSEAEWLDILDNVARFAPDATMTGVRPIGQWLDVQFTTDGGSRPRQISLRPDPDQPGRISDVFVVPWPLRYPKPVGGWPRTAPQLEATLQDRVAFPARNGDFSGAALIRQNGRVVVSEAFGFADKAAARRNTVETPFMLASAAKMFTTVAVAQLIDDGRLTLETQLGDVLPDYPNAQARSATVRQLLTHSAGMGGFFDRPGAFRGFGRASEALSLFAAAPLSFAPGTDASYSNEGYIVLGAMIEALTGRPYYSYVAEHIFTPVGMNDTGYISAGHAYPDIAVGYAFEEGDLFGLGSRQAAERAAPAEGFAGGPAGGAFSTTADMSAFMTALLDGRLVSRTTLETLLAVPVAAADGHATGFQVKRLNGRTIFGHNGGSTAGAEVNIFAVLETGDHYVLLGNQAPPVGQPISDDLAVILSGAE